MSTVDFKTQNGFDAERYYKSFGVYKDKNISEEDKNKIGFLSEQYEYSKSVGDANGMKRAHDSAEKIRAAYGYSGGTDGSEYIYVEKSDEQKKNEEKQRLYEELYNEYDKAMKNTVTVNPYATDYAKSIMETYNKLGDAAKEKAAHRYTEENNGNTDSFALANASRQKLSYKNAANEAILKSYNAAADNAYRLYKEFVQAIGK